MLGELSSPKVRAITYNPFHNKRIAIVLLCLGRYLSNDWPALTGIILVYQKGFDLVAEVIDELPKLGASFVVLGTGEPQYEQMWQSAACRHPTTIGVRIGYDETLAHLIEAGSEIFLMPSR